MAQQQVEEYKKRMEAEEREIDGESIGSQDTEYADSEEEYEQEYEEGEEVSDSEELFPTPPRPSPIPEEEPQPTTLKRKRREPSTKQLNTKKRRETMGGLFSKKNDEQQTEKPAKIARKRTAETSKTSDQPNASEVALQRPKRRSRANPSRLLENPVPKEIVDLRSSILELLCAIDKIAKHHPEKRISIRNRTRESITRHLHYERDEAKLDRMKTDAAKLLDLWKASN
ncbi:protein 33K [Goose adenovirus 4]|uniref:Protein 33K n=1 Tax=Goose adenovirus 4 TaxID=1193422 RepID=I3PMN9_9ADEN|nr:protein 33K [Goose adenovirus 4]AFC40579.1 protein 33K [Goose adenovirus 4]